MGTDWKLERFILDTCWHDLPERVRERIRGCFIDLAGALIIGSRSRQCEAGRRLADRLFAKGDIAVIGFKERYSFPGAVCVMGHASNAFDIDDGYSLLRAHPGTSFISGLLAAAYEKDLSLKEFLTVLAVAYEVTIRDGLALLDYYGFYHGSGTLGPFGIAAGVGRIRGFDQERLRNALAVAEFNAPLAPGVFSAEYPAMNKDGVPFGAIAGMLALEDTLAGFTGNRSLLHTDAARKYVDTLGRDYAVMDLYFKPYTCCRWAHPAIDACIQLMKRHGIDHRQIKKVTVRTFRQAAVMAKCLPEETDAAQYNIAYPVAAAIVHGDVGFGQVYEPFLKDPDVLGMMDKLDFETDEVFDRLFPARRFCRAKIETTDGRVFLSDAFEPYGEPGDGIDCAWLADKFRRITGPVLTKAAQESFLGRVLGESEGETVRGITDSLNQKENWLL